MEKHDVEIDLKEYPEFVDKVTSEEPKTKKHFNRD